MPMGKIEKRCNETARLFNARLSRRRNARWVVGSCGRPCDIDVETQGRGDLFAHAAGRKTWDMSSKQSPDCGFYPVGRSLTITTKSRQVGSSTAWTTRQNAPVSWPGDYGGTTGAAPPSKLFAHRRVSLSSTPALTAEVSHGFFFEGFQGYCVGSRGWKCHGSARDCQHFLSTRRIPCKHFCDSGVPLPRDRRPAPFQHHIALFSTQDSMHRRIITIQTVKRPNRYGEYEKSAVRSAVVPPGIPLTAMESPPGNSAPPINSTNYPRVKVDAATHSTAFINGLQSCASPALPASNGRCPTINDM
ncbi:hypothetical protein B0H67DRAFT_145333 [Lasiosphaeris hirsuta]|uniref:Uncharacterized protein n=1 Tax=Lasiosphaeris hirsuta TaxID=260670 RepID=A0AA40B1M7_9PEZI|nr:hypothetical protein B0H67DRAFT_145333 [Lasiosphaeris hirsuta]